MARIYLDHQNNAWPGPEVIAAVQEGLRRAGNPSSEHAEGRSSAALRDEARFRVAGLLHARPEEIVFTSSGTEANFWALSGLAQANISRGRQIVLSAVEHLSLLQSARRMEKEGWSVTLVPVDRNGLIDPEAVERAVTPQTALVSIQWANGEAGTIQPIEEVVRRVKSKGAVLHTDAVAAAGQIPIDVKAVPADALSLAANIFGGPPGVGALYLRKGLRIHPLFVGGTQEDGRRAGTENLPGIAGMGKAAELAASRMPGLAGQLSSLRDRLVRVILERTPKASLNGHPTRRLPGHASISFPGIDAETLVLALDMEGVAVGMGSACTSRTLKASHVLRAMGIEDSRALGTITVTLGPGNTQEEIDRAAEALPRVAAQQKETITA